MSASESDSEFESADEGVDSDQDGDDHSLNTREDVGQKLAEQAICGDAKLVDIGSHDGLLEQGSIRSKTEEIEAVDITLNKHDTTDKSAVVIENCEESAVKVGEETEDTEDGRKFEEDVEKVIEDEEDVEKVIEDEENVVNDVEVNEEDDGWGWEVEDVLDSEIQRITDESVSEHKNKAETQPSAKNLFDKMATVNENRQPPTSSWGWGGWGASLLSTATSSVAAFTSQVGEGLSNVLESSLGAPSPEELAKQRGDDCSEGHASPNTSSLSFDSLVTGVSSLTSALEQTSSKVLSGGLNTLEMLGKKTMDILQEGDPGLKHKRALITGQRPILSDVLKEAKLKAEQQDRREDGDEKSVIFSSVFDDCQGFIHLEALEMLSSQCEKKVQVFMLSISGEQLEEKQHEMNEIKKAVAVEMSEDDEEQPDHDFPTLIKSSLEKLDLVVKTDKLLKIQSQSHSWVNSDKDLSALNSKEVHDSAVYYLAEFCAAMMEILHRICELLLLDERRDAKLDATHLTNIASVACADVQLQASLYTSSLNQHSDDLKSVTTLVTNIFLEATNCCTCIQDALNLVIPILQLQQCHR